MATSHVTGDIRPAAVLVPIYRDQAGRLRIVFIRRAPDGPHAGQIAFPGGKPEADDDDLATTALREAGEEVGLDPHRVVILSTLPPVTTLTSRFRIHPFLAHVVPPDRWQPDPREVDRIIDLETAALGREGIHQRRTIHLIQGGTEADVPCFALPQGPVWGATYRILAPLVPALIAPTVRWSGIDHPGPARP